MNLIPSHFEIDKIMASLPTKQRYHWQEVTELLEKEGFNRGSWLWWAARHPKLKGD